MQSNLDLRLGERVLPKPLRYFNLQNLFFVISGVCIIALFNARDFSSLTNFITKKSETTSPLPEYDQPFTVNGAAAAQSSNSVSTIAADALAFKAMLTSTQQSTLQLTYTTALARKWSNLPCGISCRNGLQLGTNLTSAQYAAAMQIIKDALSSTPNEGSDEYHQMNLAEAYLHANGGGSGYDSTLRWMAFLNTPSATGAWMLQLGGHHYAANIAFNNGHVVGATPFFMGLEPKTFTYNSVTYDPLGQEKNGFANALASLSTSQLSTAYISSSFSDCVMIPGETNGGKSTFPAVATGQPLSSLTSAQQNLVLDVIKLYVGDMDSATYQAVIAGYESELSQTYISYHDNGTSGNPSSFFTNQGDYARISGPNVWIEFSCQGGIVIQGQIHYHTVWRDRAHDYGVDLSGPAIDILAASPLKLVSFTAEVKDKKPLLRWMTSNEVNVSRFDIEQSTSASGDFKTVGSVKAKNTSAENSYSFNESGTVSASILYYRLKMIDTDGKTTYSKVVPVRLTTDKIGIVNTIATSELRLTHPSSFQSGYYKISTMKGQVVTKGLLQKGAVNTPINVSSLSTGQYVISANLEGERFSGVFIKN